MPGSEDKFEIYTRELLDWNKKVNLTAITAPEEIRSKHFEDSLALLRVHDFSVEGISVIDIGAGAGFPGLPLKIELNNICLTLLDSVRKKTDFLEHIVSVLDLSHTEIVRGRAEEYAEKKRDSYDAAVARALAPLNIAAELCLPFVRQGGVFLAMKSKEAEKEADAAVKAAGELGGKIEKIVDVSPGDGSLVRKIVVIRKISRTPGGFPRKTGMAVKRPL